MKQLLIIFVFAFFQAPTTIVRNNGDQLSLKDVVIYQNEEQGSTNSLGYNYRGKSSEIAFSAIKRISFKETIKRKKGITTYRVILVKSDNSKREVEIDLVKLEGINESGKMESMNFSSIDKISF